VPTPGRPTRPSGLRRNGITEQRRRAAPARGRRRLRRDHAAAICRGSGRSAGSIDLTGESAAQCGSAPFQRALRREPTGVRRRDGYAARGCP
jgi:hypothetical protein